MREYAKIAPQFWIGPTGKAIRKLGREAVIIAMHLITNPHANMLGVYYLPLILIAHETEVPLEDTLKAIQGLCELGFCSYNELSEYIWVQEMAFYQVGEQLKANDNRVKGINEAYESLPDLPFLRDFYDKYHEAFLLEKSRENINFFKSFSKSASQLEGASTLQSQKLEQQAHKQEPENAEALKKALVPQTVRQAIHGGHSDITVVFEHWKHTFQHPQAKLDSKRQKLISQALKSGYSAGQLCEAITGCSRTPHNMGYNDSGQRYDGLHIILRDANQIDRFINNGRYPPKPMNNKERNTQANVHTLQRWLDKKIIEEKTIDGNA